MNAIHVYCVCCQKLIPREKAVFIFQTGFYNIHIPMATCSDCEQERKLYALLPQTE